MKIAIVGSGAMGQLFGAHLVHAGNEVVYIDANPELIAALNERGVTLHNESGALHTPAHAMTAGELNDVVDLVMVFTKGFHTEAAVASVRHMIGAQTVGLTLQNGLGNADILAGVFGGTRTLMGMTDFPADMRQFGEIHSSTQGKVVLGPVTPQAEATDELVRVAESIARAFDTAGLHAAVDREVRVPIWEKVVFNAAFNTLSAATGLTVGEIAASEHLRAVMDAVLREAVTVATACEVPVSRERIDAAVGNAYQHHTHHKTSMLLDREAGRRTEIDTIGGAIVRLGAERGVETPVLATLVAIVRTVTEAAGGGR